MTRFRILKKRRTIANLEAGSGGSVATAETTYTSNSGHGAHVTRLGAATRSPDVCFKNRAATASPKALSSTAEAEAEVEAGAQVPVPAAASPSAASRFAAPHGGGSPSRSPGPCAPPPTPGAIIRERPSSDLIKQKRLFTNKSSENMTRTALKSVALTQQLQSSSQQPTAMTSTSTSGQVSAASPSLKQRRRSAHCIEISSGAAVPTISASAAGSVKASSGGGKSSEKQENSIVHLLRRVKNRVHKHAMQLACDWVPPPPLLQGDRGYMERYCISTAQSATAASAGASANAGKRGSTSGMSPKRERLTARLSSPLRELPPPTRFEKRERSSSGISGGSSTSASNARLPLGAYLRPKRHSLSSNEGDKMSGVDADITPPGSGGDRERWRDSKSAMSRRSFDEEESSFRSRTASEVRRWGGSQRVRRTRFEERQSSIPVLNDDELNVEQIGEAIQLHLSLLMASKSATSRSASFAAPSTAPPQADSPTTSSTSVPEAEGEPYKPESTSRQGHTPPNGPESEQNSVAETLPPRLSAASTVVGAVAGVGVGPGAGTGAGPGVGGGPTAPTSMPRSRSCIRHEVVKIQIHPPDSDRTSPTSDDPRTPLVITAPPIPMPTSRPQRLLVLEHAFPNPISETDPLETGGNEAATSGSASGQEAGGAAATGDRGPQDAVSPTLSGSSGGSGETTCVSACGQFVRSRRRTVKF